MWASHRPPPLQERMATRSPPMTSTWTAPSPTLSSGQMARCPVWLARYEPPAAAHLSVPPPQVLLADEKRQCKHAILPMQHMTVLLQQWTSREHPERFRSVRLQGGCHHNSCFTCRAVQLQWRSRRACWCLTVQPALRASARAPLVTGPATDQDPHPGMEPHRPTEQAPPPTGLVMAPPTVRPLMDTGPTAPLLMDPLRAPPRAMAALPAATHTRALPRMEQPAAAVFRGQ